MSSTTTTTHLSAARFRNFLSRWTGVVIGDRWGAEGNVELARCYAQAAVQAAENAGNPALPTDARERIAGDSVTYARMAKAERRLVYRDFDYLLDTLLRQAGTAEVAETIRQQLDELDALIEIAEQRADEAARAVGTRAARLATSRRSGALRQADGRA